MRSPSSGKCLHCKGLFVPCPNHHTTQHYCGQPACRQASKAAAQARWRQQPQNRDYFRGPEHVERVRRWRACHPGYGRKPASGRSPALQDFASLQPLRLEALTTGPTDSMAGQRPAEPPRAEALQDLAGVQVPLLVGLVSSLLGEALQDRFEEVTRHLVDRGKRVLAAER